MIADRIGLLFASEAMSCAINFDDQQFAQTREVYDEPFNRNLTSKVQALLPQLPKRLPQARFLRR